MTVKSAEKPSVIMDASWSGKGRGAFSFQSITEKILLPVLKRNIHLTVPHGNPDGSSIDDGLFRIFFYSANIANVGIKSGRTPAKIWNCDVYCSDSLVSPQCQGHPIVDQDTGWVVAELDGNNLFIHHDLCHGGYESELAIYEQLLKEVKSLLMLPVEKRQKMLEEKRGHDLEESRASFLKMMTPIKYRNGADSLKEEIKRLESDSMNYRQTLMKKLVELNQLREQLSQSRKDGEFSAEKCTAEFERIAAMPKVARISVENNQINVWTKLLYCRNKATGLLHEIGAFRFEINPVGRHVRWNNLTHRVDAYSEQCHHPHIFGPGNFCLGNAEDILSELLGKGEIRSLVSIMIQFIESVNHEDPAGQFIFAWPLAPKAMQSAEAQEKIRRLAPLMKGNPLRDIDNDYNFVTEGKKMKRGATIRFDGDDLYWRDKDDDWDYDSRMNADSLAGILDVDTDLALVALSNYFNVIGDY